MKEGAAVFRTMDRRLRGDDKLYVGMTRGWLG